MGGLLDKEVKNTRQTEKELVDNVADLEEQAVLAMVRRLLDDGVDPLSIIYACDRGMRVVGERYAQGEYYIAALIMAGEIFRQVVELVEPHVEIQAPEAASGHVLLGTVQGDIHDIGKDVFGMLLVCHGFHVNDLGVDVPSSRFVDAACEERPDIVGLSGLLTSAYDQMRETVTALRRAMADWEQRPYLIVGGGQIDEEICRYVGADDWRLDAMDGVHLCQRLMAERRGSSEDVSK